MATDPTEDRDMDTPDDDSTSDATWCVAGQETHDDPWELLVTGLPDRDAAEQWLRDRCHDANLRKYTEVYIDPEDNDGHADTYYGRTEDGSVIEYQGSDTVLFAAAPEGPASS